MEPKVVIEKVSVELNLESSMSSEQLMKSTDIFVKREILPLLEKLLLSYPTGTAVRLPLAQLDIDLESLDLRGILHSPADLSTLSENLAGKLKRQVDRQLTAQVTSRGNSDEKDSPEEILFFFLETGRFPWYAPASYDLESELTAWLSAGQVSQAVPAFVSRLKKLLVHHPPSFYRLLHQFTSSTLLNLLSLEAGKTQPAEALRAVEDLVKSNFLASNRLLLRLIFYKNWIYPNPSQHVLMPLHKQIAALSLQERKLLSNLRILNLPHLEAKTNLVKKEVSILSDQVLFDWAVLQEERLPDPSVEAAVPIQEKSPRLTESEDEGAPQESLYIQNAGLILIHPFLTHFFKKINVWESGSAFHPESYDLILHALHYISSGKTDAMENQFLLEKFLCGIPLNFPVDRQVVLSDEIKKEGDELLKAAIGYWEKLKSTSPEGLRELFIYREGKLDTTHYKLTVNRKAQDLLLDSLPWNISMIKLPWLKKPLHVTW